MFVGIDVSASRGFDVAMIDEGRHLSLLAKARDIEALQVIIRGAPREALFAVDSPPRPSMQLLGDGRTGRVAEAEALARGIPLYQVPATEDDAPSWMRAGFSVFKILEREGFGLFTGALAGAVPPSGVSFEVYPYLSYVVLSGGRRPRTKAPLEWARQVIKGRVLGLPAQPTKDSCDAAIAAYTAWSFAKGEWSGLGDPREGVIIAPCSAADLPGPHFDPDQLAFPIEASDGREPIGPVKRLSFAERVLRMIGRVPHGAVTTYGDIARWCGKPGAARAVGTLVAARGIEVPSHRVVNASGSLSAAFPGGVAEQRRRLESEGVPFDNGRVSVESCRWKGPA